MSIQRLAYMELRTHPSALQWYCIVFTTFQAYINVSPCLKLGGIYRLSSDELLVAAGQDLITIKFSKAEGTLRVMSALPQMHEVMVEWQLCDRIYVAETLILLSL